MNNLIRRAWDWLRRKIFPRRDEEASPDILIGALDRLEGRYYALRNGVPIDAGKRLEPGDRIEIIGDDSEEVAEMLVRREIEKQAPSRARLRAIIDRLPDHDRWLDDEYDWDL